LKTFFVRPSKLNEKSAFFHVLCTS